MAVLGTFSTFTTARLGIYASSASLQVTGNNIANINTTGYTRQRADLYSLNSTGTAKYANPLGVDIGYGVLVKSTTQLRDPYLDIRYRNENTKLGAANATLAGLQKLSQTLDEVNQGTSQNGRIEDCLMNFKSMLEGLSKQVGSEEQDGLVREAAKSLTTFFNTAASKLQEDWNLQRDELVDTVKEVNDILVNIRNLNEQIRKQGIYGDLALEQRDDGNLEIDKLSELVGINVEYSLERIDQYTDVEKLTITLKDTKDPRSGEPIKLVDGLFAAQLSLSEIEANPDYVSSELQTPKLNTGADKDTLPYLDESGKPTDDITKANMLRMNPDFLNYPLAVVSENPTQYVKYGTATTPPTLTTDPAEAARVVNNPDYLKSVPVENPAADPDDPDTRYLAATGGFTGDVNAAKRAIPNPDYDPDDANSLPYLKADGTPANAADAAHIGKYMAATPAGATTDDITKAEQVGKYLDAQGNVVKDQKDAALASRKYLTDPKNVGKVGATTNDPEMAAPVDANKFLFQVERLEDKFGRPLDQDKPTESVVVPLNDNDLMGALQSMRELLTEEGEFASKSDVGVVGRDANGVMTDEAIKSYLASMKDADGNPLYSDADITAILGSDDAKKQVSKMLERSADDNAGIKNGIPYYQKRLDLLAQKFAQIFNEANQLPASTVYETNTPAGTIPKGTDLFTNPKDGSTNFIDKNGKTITITLDDVTTVVQQQKKDPAGNPVFEADGKTPVMVNVEDEYGRPVRVPKNDAKSAELLEILREQGQLKEAYEYYDGGVLFSNNGNNNDPSGITAANITISNSWASRTVRVLNSTQPDVPAVEDDPTTPDVDESKPAIKHSSANDNINHMISLFEQKLNYSASEIEADAAKGGQIFFQGSFQEMYTNLGATLGSQTSMMNGVAYNYEITTLNIDNSRLSVSGVDLNDEATSMMQFQKSYQAACRLLTTIDSMLDTLINGTLR